MDLTIPAVALADASAYLARYLPTAPVAPPLAAIRVCAARASAVLSCYDLEVDARATVHATVAEPGDVLLPGRLVAEIAARLPDGGDVRLQTEPRGPRVVLRAGRLRYLLPTMSPAAQPAAPTAQSGADGSVGAADLAASVARVARAAGTDVTTPTLASVELRAESTALTLVATDRFRLAVGTIPWAPAHGEATVARLVPTVTLRAVAAGFRTAGEVGVRLGDGAGPNVVTFASETRALTTRVLDGAFPAWKSLLPTRRSSRVHVDPTALADAVRRCGLVTPKKVPVRVSVDTSSCTIVAGDAEAPDAVDRVDADLVGEPLTVHLNPAYLVDGLTALSGDRAVLTFDGPLRPVELTCADDEAAFRYVVMPVRQ